MRSWFLGRRFPLAVGVAFWSGDAIAVQRVDSSLTAKGALCTGLQQAMERLAGRTVCGLRLAAAGTGGAGRVELDVLLTSDAGGGGSGGARASGGGRGGDDAEAAGAAAGWVQPGRGQEPEAAADVGAALQALRLPDIAPRPAGVAAGDAHAAAAQPAHEDAALAAFDQAGRVADALGLSWEETDDLKAGVVWATAEAGRCRRFLDTEYSRLRDACCAGDEERARAWCELVAAAGRSAA
jgi:hypothetical protein